MVFHGRPPASFRKFDAWDDGFGRDITQSDPFIEFLTLLVRIDSLFFSMRRKYIAKHAIDIYFM